MVLSSPTAVLCGILQLGSQEPSGNRRDRHQLRMAKGYTAAPPGRGGTCAENDRKGGNAFLGHTLGTSCFWGNLFLVLGMEARVLDH